VLLGGRCGWVRVCSGELFGLLEVVEGIADLAAHGVGRGEVDEVAGLPFGGQAGDVDVLGKVEGSAGVTEVDGDGVDGDVGGAEFGAVVFAEQVGGFAGLVEVVVGLHAVVVAGGGDGEDELACAVQRQDGGIGSAGSGGVFEGADNGGGCLPGLAS
jgi:hypothetical protein